MIIESFFCGAHKVRVITIHYLIVNISILNDLLRTLTKNNDRIDDLLSCRYEELARNMPIFLVILMLFFVAQSYVLWRYYQLLPNRRFLKLLGGVGALFLTVSLPISLFFVKELPLWLVKPLYLTGTSWMMILIYLFLPLFLLDIFRIVNHFQQWVPAAKIHRLRVNNGWVFSILFIVYAAMITFGNQNYHHKKRFEYHYDLLENRAIAIEDAADEHLSCDLPYQSLLKIVMISDLHLGHIIGVDELEAWRALINAENADYIFVSGDVIDNDVRPLYAENMAEGLSQFQAKNGVYMVLGNHEYIAGVENSIAFLEDTNWQLLRDEVVLLPEEIYLVGRDDKMNPERAALAELLAGLEPDKVMIVLDHQPMNFPKLAQLGDFLQFSGHTHDGQVWPYNHLAKKINGVSSGLWNFSDSQLLISAGIGIWGGQFRIGTHSDYRVMTMCLDNR